MPEVALLPNVTLTLAPQTVLVHVQPNVSLLASASLILVPFSAKAVTITDWPATLPQYFLDDGNYSEIPFASVVETQTDSGVQKTRKRFTGKFKTIQASIWLSDNSQLAIFNGFYYGQADQGNSFFSIPVPSGGGTKVVRFIPGTLSIVSDGGVGWRAGFQLKQQPEAI